MGCFDATCCISGLPIHDQDPIRFLLLTEHGHEDNHWRSGVNGWYTLRTAPLKGRYNDYGSIEKYEKCMTERVFFSGLDYDVVAKGVGDNTCHDVEVIPGMDQDRWLEALREGRVEVNRRKMLNARDAQLDRFYPKKIADTVKLGDSVVRGELEFPEVGPIPSFQKVQKVLANAGYPISDWESDTGFYVDDLAHGLVRIRPRQFTATKQDPAVLLPLLSSYWSSMLVAGDREPGQAMILVAPKPFERTKEHNYSWSLSFDIEHKKENPISKVVPAMIREDVWQVLLGMLSDTQKNSMQERALSRAHRVGGEIRGVSALGVLADSDTRFKKAMALSLLISELRDDVTEFNFGLSHALTYGLLCEESVADKEQFARDVAEAQAVQSALASIHGQWYPHTSSGQCSPFGPNRRFHEEIVRICKEQEKKYNETYEEDE